MSVTAEGPVVSRPRAGSWLWHRQLDTYPETGPRIAFLAITVLATITLYYELYVGGSVATLLLTNLHMTFTFYVITLAFGNLIGAFGSVFAGLTDRFGRANLVVVGLLIHRRLRGVHHPGRDEQVGVHHRGVRGRVRRGRLPGGHPGADQGLFPASRPGHGDGILDQRPGARQPDRRGRRQRHHSRDRDRPAFLDPRVPHLRHRRAGRVRDRADRAARAVPAAARPADGDHTRPGAHRGPGQGPRPRRTSRPRCVTRSASCSSPTSSSPPSASR